MKSPQELQDEVVRKLAKFIRTEREYRMSQIAFSERLYCGRATISRMEGGHSVRSEYLIAALVELGLAPKFIEILDAALAEPPSKREKDERQRRFDAIMAPYL
ncbi:hypothetical protein LG272_10640 [Pseudidiomarina marina]|uniref:hypothetical protein n=1 Tax=Pseudidiomarina marina TaxID=502366 RepID=UPI00384EB747